jgi:hypothetical protein
MLHSFEKLGACPSRGAMSRTAGLTLAYTPEARRRMSSVGKKPQHRAISRDLPTKGRRTTAPVRYRPEIGEIYRRYAIVDEQMHREAAAKLDVWHDEQQAKAEAARKGQVKRFKKRQTA